MSTLVCCDLIEVISLWKGGMNLMQTKKPTGASRLPTTCYYCKWSRHVKAKCPALERKSSKTNTIVVPQRPGNNHPDCLAEPVEIPIKYKYIKNFKNSTRVGIIVDQEKVLKQAGVVHDIKSQ